MKHTVIRKTLSIALSCIVLMLCSDGVSSEEDVVPDTLAFYQHKIELLNEKYGTDLALATFIANHKNKPTELYRRGGVSPPVIQIVRFAP